MVADQGRAAEAIGIALLKRLLLSSHPDKDFTVLFNMRHDGHIGCGRITSEYKVDLGDAVDLGMILDDFGPSEEETQKRGELGDTNGAFSVPHEPP
jgi:hypothetical protein